MDADRLEWLERLCRCATGGDWICDPLVTGDSRDVVSARAVGGLVATAPIPTDAHFIASARQALPDLLAYVRELEAGLERKKSSADALGKAQRDAMQVVWLLVKRAGGEVVIPEAEILAMPADPVISTGPDIAVDAAGFREGGLRLRVSSLDAAKPPPPGDRGRGER
jgi:hypothetical protein